MLKRISLVVLYLLLAAAAVSAQEGATVNVSAGPPPAAWQTVLVYSGSNVVYRCWARSFVETGTRAVTEVPISAASNASPVSFTATGHGFDINSMPQVTVSGGTGNWTAVNGKRTAIITSADTFTVPVDSTAFGAVTGTLIFTTSAPRTTQREWAVQTFSYDGSNNVIGVFWLNGSASITAKCSDGASATRSQQ